jgi:hypothetical protein
MPRKHASTKKCVKKDNTHCKPKPKKAVKGAVAVSAQVKAVKVADCEQPVKVEKQCEPVKQQCDNDNNNNNYHHKWHQYKYGTVIIATGIVLAGIHLIKSHYDKKKHCKTNNKGNKKNNNHNRKKQKRFGLRQ